MSINTPAFKYIQDNDFPSGNASRKDKENKKTVQAIISPANNPLPIPFGERIVTGQRVYRGVFASGGSDYLHLISVFGEGEIEAINDIRLDGKPTGNYTVTTEIYLGTLTQTVCGLNAYDANFTDRMKGTAYVYLIIKEDPDFARVPVVTAKIKGIKCLDPRDNTTKWTANPALVRAEWMVNQRFGMRLASARINWDSVGTIADYCAEIVRPSNGYTSNLISILSANDKPIPYIASASAETVGKEAWKAVDNDIATFYSTTASSSWWQFQFQPHDDFIFTKIRIYAKGTTAPKDFTIEGSNDGTNFTVLKTVTGQTFIAGGEWIDFTFTNTTIYKIYRISVTATGGGYLEMYGVEMMETDFDVLRYEINQVYDSPQSKQSIADDIDLHFLGGAFFNGDKWDIITAQPKAYAAFFEDKEVWNVQLKRPEQQNRVNRVVIEYTHPNTLEAREISLESPSIVANQEEILERKFSIKGYYKPEQARFAGMILLNMARKSLEITFNTYNLKGLQRFDVFRFTHASGFDNNLFMAISVDEANGTIAAIEYGPEIFGRGLL